MTRPRVRLKPIALPAEHGSWGFLLEPLVLGLALAPTVAGVGIMLAVAATFLIRNPLRVFLRARAGSKGSPRLIVARRVAVVYAAVVVLGVALCMLSAGVRPLWPLVVVSPLLVLFIVYDSRNQGRTAIAEAFGPLGLAASAPAIALAAGWNTAPALAVWAILVAKALPTVVYVRARLRLEDGNAVSVWPATLAHAAGVAVLVGLWRGALAPLSAAVALAVLTLRAAVGLTRFRWGRRPKQIGILEFVFSGLYVLAVAVGWYASM